MWWVTTQKNGASALGLQRVLGLKKYETAWTRLYKFRRAMVRPGRDLLTGRVEVDECYVGGLEEGLPGRLNLKKALVVVAAQEDGPGIGRIRMRQIVDASADSLMPFVRDSVEAGSVIHTDGWQGYLPLERKGYKHDVTFMKGKKKTPSELMPRVHRVISLLKRWLLGTHQGAVSHKHLDYYLDEFTSDSIGGDQRAEESSSIALRNKLWPLLPSRMTGSSTQPRGRPQGKHNL
jgi:transposase-like protein